MTSKGDQKDIERRLQSIIGSMRISGGEPTEETIITMRGILSGALDADEEIERIVARYKNKPSNVESTTADDFTINEGHCVVLDGLDRGVKPEGFKREIQQLRKGDWASIYRKQMRGFDTNCVRVDVQVTVSMCPGLYSVAVRKMFDKKGDLMKNPARGVEVGDEFIITADYFYSVWCENDERSRN